ncbi:hypothetical protein ACO0K2_05700 [Undibacterium sp. MH2W]|uniref:hypothetical protein n=1 Tax=Undibacterium sp. MH2W TaxID=3413044 RepID=UPI003BF43FE7
MAIFFSRVNTDVNTDAKAPKGRREKQGSARKAGSIIGPVPFLRTTQRCGVREEKEGSDEEGQKKASRVTGCSTYQWSTTA